MNDVTHRKRGLRFEKKQLVEFLSRNERVEIQSWARPDDFLRYGRRALVELRADNVKAVSIERSCLSLLMSNNLLLKGNKVSYLNQFRVFGFLYMFMNILWTLCLFHRDIGPAVRVFANGPGDLGSIPGRVIPKTLKMVLDTTLLNTQHYKVRFKGKVEQSWEWSSALPYTLV